MPSQILSTANTAADSTDVTVTSGSPVTACLKGVVDNTARVIIAVKDDGGAYTVVGEINSTSPVATITGPGVYRFSRIAGGTCGVFSA